MSEQEKPSEEGAAPLDGKRKPSAKERFGSKMNPFGPKSLNAVGRTADFQRIAQIPRRESWVDYSEALTLAFAKPPLKPGTCPELCPCGGAGWMKLRPRQAWALAEIFEQRGGVGALGVGEGKTLIGFLLPLLMEWERAVLFVPAGLRQKALQIDYPLLSRHWNLPPLEGPGNLDIRSYEELSQTTFSDYLSKRRIPDGLVFDEVQALKNRGSGRSKRVHRYMQEFPFTEFAGFSGSLVHRSVMDYGHLLNFALKETSPVPHSFLELKTWSDALDEGIPEWVRPSPGALMEFCREGETVRTGYKRRLLESPGFIASAGLSTNIGLQLIETPHPDVPVEVQNAFQRLRNTGTLPGGEVCTTALDQRRHARELFMGFYYKWVWPDGKVDLEWLKKRAMWRKYVRKMTTRSHGGFWLDTEKQVALAVVDGLVECSEDELAADGKTVIRRNVNVYAEWVEISKDRRAKWGGKREPPKETVWISDYMLEFVEKWASEHEGAEAGIVWIESIGFLEKLRERAQTGLSENLQCFGAGENEIELVDGKKSIFASFAHTVGKNLQMFHRMFFPNPLSSGKAWEQGLGREHRPGQKADDVIAEVCLGCRESWWSFEQSKLDARYVEQTMGQEQRLNKATMFVTTTEDVALKRCEEGDPLWALTGHAKMDGKIGVLQPDGTRADTATPILTALKEEAKRRKKSRTEVEDVEEEDSEEEESEEDSEETETERTTS